jgi:hypothetical protein
MQFISLVTVLDYCIDGLTTESYYQNFLQFLMLRIIIIIIIIIIIGISIIIFFFPGRT